MRTLRPGLYGDDPSPRLGFLRGVFLANHLASNDNLARTTKRQNTQQRKITIHKITLYRFNQGGGLILLQGGSNRSRGLSPLAPSL